MAGNHSTTTNYNINVLTDKLGLKRLLNTSIFQKDKVFVLSPAVMNDANWFDLRKVNLDKFNSNTHKGYLLIRLKDRFLLADLKSFIDSMISDSKVADTPNSGVHWKFLINSDSQGTYTVVNRLDKRQFLMREVATDDLIEVFNNATFA